MTKQQYFDRVRNSDNLNDLVIQEVPGEEESYFYFNSDNLNDLSIQGVQGEEESYIQPLLGDLDDLGSYIELDLTNMLKDFK